MHELIENQQQDRYPGLRVRRDGDAVVVHIPMRLRRRNGRCMVMAEGEAEPVSAAKHVEDTGGANRILIEAIAKGHRWQAQLESGEYAGLEDLAKDVGCDRTYVGRMLRLTSLAPDIIEAILRGDEPDGLSLEKLRKNLSVRWDEQRRTGLVADGREG
ncbi:MAG: hypothetical protein BWX88_01835 [Planctomycetes bacterium ADurb.Bin126]|nr:MAG: hypothetical protein BWX88_01835 [Planctomycetes bacterium ADurb.Bin126]